MNKNWLRYAVLFALVLIPCVGHATALGTAGAYNEFIIGSLIQTSTDSQGKVAVGGDATFSNMSVASQIQDPDPPDLVVGGNLFWENGSVGISGDGSIVVGGNAFIAQSQGGSTVAFGSLTTQASPLPIDFAAEKAYLQSTSTFWGGLAATGTTELTSGHITLTGNDPFLNIFLLPATDIAQNILFDIRVPAGATTLVNIPGGSAQLMNFGFAFNGVAPDLLFPDELILYNFFEATSLEIAGIEVHGSILAPWANTLFNNGHIEGNLIARTFFGTGEAHNELFEGNLPSQPVPEPATLALLGVGLIGLAAWKKRK